MSDSKKEAQGAGVDGGKAGVTAAGPVVTDRMHRAAMVYLSEQRVAVASQHVNGALKAAMAELEAPAGFVALADLERMVDFGLSAHEVLESSRKLAAGGMLIHGNKPVDGDVKAQGKASSSSGERHLPDGLLPTPKKLEQRLKAAPGKSMPADFKKAVAMVKRPYYFLDEAAYSLVLKVAGDSDVVLLDGKPMTYGDADGGKALMPLKESI